MAFRVSRAFSIGMVLAVCHCGGGETGDGHPDPGSAGTGGGRTSSGGVGTGGRVGTAGASAGTSVSGAATGAGNGGSSGRPSGGAGRGGASLAGSSSGGASGESDAGSAGQALGTVGGDAGGAGAPNAGAGGSGGALDPIVESLDIGKVWSGHFVQFYLLTQGDRQFAAFYDENRALTVAERRLGTSAWNLVRLPTTIGWDSHNYVVMAIDDGGFIHVSGNMHSSPLIYFRTDSALDIGTFVKRGMIDSNENSATYPQFFRSPGGDLVFMYRDGSSGNGNHIFNTYSTSTKTWRRLLNAPLTDGEGQRNAYPVGPIQGPDGLFHLVWVWRDTPDASTNHDLSYARTADLLNWKTAAGSALTLPIKLGTSDIVDPVPSGGGMINNNTKVGFDADGRPVVAYHKFDASGNTQLYNARFENNQWVRYKTSSWDYRWEFGGTGTLVFDIEVEPVELQSDGTLTQSFYHARYGGQGAFRLNPTTLAAEATIPRPVPYPTDLATLESPTASMEVRWQKDAGQGPDADVIYMLRWETLPSNRDMPRTTIPPATTLRLYGFRRKR